ncbi:MAG TPA: MliC family protein [Alphaproteobacteria bacterium]
MRSFALVLVLLLVSACASRNPDDPITAVYNCEDGSRLDVVFEPHQAVITTQNGTMATLEQKAAASGIWYSNARYDLRGKGREAMWSVGRRVAIACKAR